MGAARGTKDGNECNANWVAGEIKDLFNAICLLGNQVKMNTGYTCPELREKVRTWNSNWGIISKQILFKSHKTGLGHLGSESKERREVPGLFQDW